MDEPEPATTGDNRNPDGTFKNGTSGNPNGRPKGSFSIKDRVRQYLESNPEDMEAYVKHFVEKNRELSWQMLEGRPQQDVISDGKALPQPLLNVLYNNSNEEDSGTQEKD